MFSALEHFKVYVVCSTIGLNLPLTNVSVALVMSLGWAMFLFYHNGKIIISGYYLWVTSFLYFSWGIFRESFSHLKGGNFLLNVSLFMFVLMLNLLGLMPYFFSVTSQLVMTLGLSFTFWLGCTILSISNSGNNWFSHFMPNGSPFILSPLLVGIELMSYSARAISLGLSLGANIISGHLLLGMMSSFTLPLNLFSCLPVVLTFALLFMEFSVALIQSYVFYLLINIYLSDT